MEIQNQFGIVGHAYRYCFININIPKQAGADGGNFPAAIPSKIPQYRADKTYEEKQVLDETADGKYSVASRLSGYLLLWSWVWAGLHSVQNAQHPLIMKGRWRDQGWEWDFVNFFGGRATPLALSPEYLCPSKGAQLPDWKRKLLCLGHVSNIKMVID